MKTSLFFMKDNKLLHDSRKTYYKVKKLVIKNAIKGKSSFIYYRRLLKARKLIIKWYYKHGYSLVMIDLAELDYTIDYGLHNGLDNFNTENINHIILLIKDFNRICEKIEEYYG